MRCCCVFRVLKGATRLSWWALHLLSGPAFRRLRCADRTAHCRDLLCNVSGSFRHRHRLAGPALPDCGSIRALARPSGVRRLYAVNRAVLCDEDHDARADLRATHAVCTLLSVEILLFHAGQIPVFDGCFRRSDFLYPLGGVHPGCGAPVDFADISAAKEPSFAASWRCRDGHRHLRVGVLPSPQLCVDGQRKLVRHSQQFRRAPRVLDDLLGSHALPQSLGRRTRLA